MANIVLNTIRPIGSEEALEQFDYIMGDLYVSEECLEYAVFLPDWDNEVAPTKDWLQDHIGSNIAWVSHMTQTSATIRSTWSNVIPFAGLLAHHLRDYDNDVRLEVTFVDELLNFAGVGLWHQGKWHIESKDGKFFGGWTDDEVDHMLSIWLVRRKVCL